MIIKAIIIIHILGLTSQSVCKIIQSANFPFNSSTPLTLHFPVHQTCKFIFFGTLICSIVLQIRRAIFLFLKSGRAQLQASGFESDIEARFQNEETSDFGKSRKKNWKRNGNNPWELCHGQTPVLLPLAIIPYCHSFSNPLLPFLFQSLIAIPFPIRGNSAMVRPLWRAADCGAKGPPLTALPGILWVFATLYRHPSLSRPSSISPSLSTYSTSWLSNTSSSDRMVFVERLGLLQCL